jgi:hypothetical protein
MQAIVFRQNEEVLNHQYYSKVINQKVFFQQSSNERLSKQNKIAQNAKNDNEDQQEVEMRHIYGLLKLYNKYLKIKMLKEQKECEQLENVCLKIEATTVSL